MGERITVTTYPGASESVRIFSCDRSLTGQEIERYPTLESASGNGPAQVLARRLFGLGIASVGVYSNVVTVDADAAKWAVLEPQVVHAIEHLYEYYGDEAGWSPTARAAMGVSVRAPKEVAAE
ncbi:MAG: NifU N-terminal domain-containing protein [Acidimicrobiia bacterium]